jgi:hypothetical protein
MMTQFLNNTVVYGDPKAIAYMYDFGDSSHPYLEKFTRSKGAGAAPDTFSYTATGHLTNAVNSSGTSFYYGLRPFRYLPVRIDPSTVAIQKNDGHNAAITENFMLWSMLEGNTESLAKGVSKVLRWTAKTVEERTPVRPILSYEAPSPPRMAVRQPAHGNGVEIRLTGDIPGPVNICLFDAAGRKAAEKIFASPDSPHLMRMGGAPAGMYYAIARFSRGSLAAQFVLSR